MTLIYPMFAMVVLTFLVGGVTAFVRIRGAYTGEVDRRYFRLMGGYAIPDDIAKFGRNLNNLFEVPTLFYAVSILAIVLQVVSPLLLVLAWLFVGLRVLHSLIHLTYNHPLHRFVPFLASFLCVVVMWGDLVLSVGESL